MDGNGNFGGGIDGMLFLVEEVETRKKNLAPSSPSSEYQTDETTYFSLICARLRRRKIRANLFRWHVCFPFQ